MTLVSGGDKSRTIILPTTGTFTVTFQAPGEPFAIETRVGTGDATTRIIRYPDLTLPAGVTAQLLFTAQGPAALRYDRDGDGTFETSVTPTIDASGASAQDQDAPAISVTQTAHAGGVVVTLDAQDSPSGVQSVRYSLDGAHFQRYSGPFLVDTRAVARIYSFADDRVGNRSPLIETAIATPTAPAYRIYLPLITALH